MLPVNGDCEKGQKILALARTPHLLHSPRTLLVSLAFSPPTNSRPASHYEATGSGWRLKKGNFAEKPCRAF